MGIKHIVTATTPAGVVDKFRHGDEVHAIASFNNCIDKVWPGTGGIPMYVTVYVERVTTTTIRDFDRKVGVEKVTAE